MPSPSSASWNKASRPSIRRQSTEHCRTCSAPSVLLAILQSCSRSVDRWLPKRTVLWMPMTRKSVNPKSSANSTTDLRFVVAEKAGMSMMSEDARPTMAPASQGWCPAQRHGGYGGVPERRPMTEIMSPSYGLSQARPESRCAGRSRPHQRVIALITGAVGAPIIQSCWPGRLTSRLLVRTTT